MGLMQSVRARRAAATTGTRSRRSGGGVNELIEERLETPVFLAVTVMMVIRAAQVFSGGALVMSRWLGPVWYPRFEIFTGVGLGTGSELLMAMAGRSWRRWRRESYELATRPGLSKPQRVAKIAEAQENARYAFVFMWVGGASTLFTGVSYLFTNSAQGFDVGLAVTDLMTCAVITAVVLYIGVFRERKDQGDRENLTGQMRERMNGAALAALDRFDRKEHTDEDARLIEESLPVEDRMRWRRVVAKANKGRTWKTAQIRERLGYGRDAGRIRELNRQVLALARDAANGLEKDADGRTWLIPHALVMEVWGEAMAEHAALGRLGLRHDSDTARTTDPRSVVENSGLPTSAPDNDRAGAGDKGIVLLSAKTPKRRTIDVDGREMSAAEIALELYGEEVAARWRDADPKAATPKMLARLRDSLLAKRAQEQQAREPAPVGAE